MRQDFSMHIQHKKTVVTRLRRTALAITVLTAFAGYRRWRA
jgi:hypothetical protein